MINVIKSPYKISSEPDFFTKCCLFPTLKHFRRPIYTGKQLGCRFRQTT